MSLGYIYVKCDDGKYYRGGTLGTADWYICFDEDEDPELVIKKSKFESGLTPDAVIKLIGLDGKVISKKREFLGRCFGKDIGQCPLEEAISVYLRINSPPPAKWIRDYDKVCPKFPDGEGTIWTFERR